MLGRPWNRFSLFSSNKKYYYYYYHYYVLWWRWKDEDYKFSQVLSRVNNNASNPLAGGGGSLNCLALKSGSIMNEKIPHKVCNKLWAIVTGDGKLSMGLELVEFIFGKRNVYAQFLLLICAWVVERLGIDILLITAF